MSHAVHLLSLLSAVLLGAIAAQAWRYRNEPGVPADRREAILAEGARLDVDGIAGHGLGLAIVRRMCERMHGTCGSDPGRGGRGSRFWFELPGG